MDSEWLKTVTPCSKFCINISHLNESETLKTVMSEFFFCEAFSPGHVIITTIIRELGDFRGLKSRFCRKSIGKKSAKSLHGTCCPDMMSPDPGGCWNEEESADIPVILDINSVTTYVKM